MKKWWIEYFSEYQPSPLSFWVHRHLDNDVWSLASRFEPDLPKAIPSRGYPVLFVETFETCLRFSSIEEVQHFLDVISRKNMPTSSQLTKGRNGKYGPNAHWLSRLPARLKSWRNREKLIPVVQNGLEGLKTVLKGAYGYEK